MSATKGLVAIAVANLAYLLAVTQRTSLAVASLDAAERFHINASLLASMAALQIATYAAMQIPVGILLDRFGARRMLIAGGVIMAIGQAVVALSSTIEPAVAGRILVGMGDAFTFISMIRMVNSWLSGKRASIVQQWVSTIGQLGQVISAIPFVVLLETTSWETAFLTLSASVAFGAAMTYILVRENPEHHEQVQPKLKEVIRLLFANIKRHPVKMGFWTHYSTPALGNVFAILWGVPFLVSGEGLTRSVAAGLITLFVLTNASFGPFIGWFAAKHPAWQYRLIIAVPLSAMVSWAVVLLWPGRAPTWMLMLLAVVLGIGGPTSMLAFDYSRKYVTRRELGAANGFVNIGGFLASFVIMGLIGLGLDFANMGQPRENLYSLGNFKQVLWVQFVVIGIGILGYAYEHRKTLMVEGHRE